MVWCAVTMLNVVCGRTAKFDTPITFHGHPLYPESCNSSITVFRTALDASKIYQVCVRIGRIISRLLKSARRREPSKVCCTRDQRWVWVEHWANTIPFIKLFHVRMFVSAKKWMESWRSLSASYDHWWHLAPSKQFSDAWCVTDSRKALLTSLTDSAACAVLVVRQSISIWNSYVLTVTTSFGPRWAAHSPLVDMNHTTSDPLNVTPSPPPTPLRPLLHLFRLVRFRMMALQQTALFIF